MSIETVKTYLSGFGLDGRVQQFDVSSATVELAAQALGCKAGRIAKTLSFLSDDGPILVVAAGDEKIDNHKFKETFSHKAKMIPADRVEELIGHRVGGVCPFAVKEGVRVYLDESLKRFPTVFPAAGSSNSAIELGMDELERCSKALCWVDVCKL